MEAFRKHFPASQIQVTKPTMASEDFGCFGTEWHVPSVFWFVGGIDPIQYAKAESAGRLKDIPSNHNPHFAPVIHPTLETGVQTLVSAAKAWLSPVATKRS
jgi:metal-dependent amidase/aminoacylase/carboxypeptidase family protein